MVPAINYLHKKWSKGNSFVKLVSSFYKALSQKIL